MCTTIRPAFIKFRGFCFKWYCFYVSCGLIHGSTTVIYSVHCIHGGTALIFRTLCPWLYEVLSNIRISIKTARVSRLSVSCGYDTKQKLLFVHQTTSQHYLLNRYGNDMSLRRNLHDNEILSSTLLLSAKNKSGLPSSWLFYQARPNYRIN